MALLIRRFTVSGRGEFPLDMLRYDCCWPRTSEDSALMGASGERHVVLNRYTEGRHGPVATEGRWRSFCWDVIKEE